MATYSPDVNIRVAVIEQSSAEREYLLSLVAHTPGVELSGAHSGLADSLVKLHKEPPDVVIVDLVAIDGVALDWLRRLHSILPHTSVLVLSQEEDRKQIVEALEAGVSGWLHKPCATDQIVRAIFVLHEGGAVLSSPVARKILEYFHARGSSVDRLTDREGQVLRLLAEGLQPAEIARKLGLKLSTVRVHVRNLLSRLKVNSSTEAVAKYLNPVERLP